MKSLASWCVRHRRWVLLFWLVALVGASFLSNAIGTAYSNSFTLPHTESTQALSLLQSAAPKQSGDTEQIVFQASGGTKVTDPAVQASVDSMIAKVGTVPHVSNFSPARWSLPSASSHISPDGTIGFVTVTFNQENLGNNTSLAKQFVTAAKTAQGPNLKVAVAGQLAEASNPQSFGGISTLLGVFLAAMVLAFIFRSGFAMALPLISALASLGTAIGVIGLLSHLLKMPQFSVELVALIGLGVGVDYALFIVTRHRQGLIAGNDTEDSIVNAVNTSGRAVLFAGIIVCIALLGMFALGVSFLYGLAVAAAIGVAFTMLAALTLLPAFLGFIGPKVLSRRQKRELATTGPRVVGSGNTGFWPRYAGLIQRHSGLPAVLALIVIVLVALPFFSLRLGNSDQGNDPTSTTTRQAYDLLAKGFGPGFTGPLELVTVNPGTANSQVINQLAAVVKTQPDVARVSPPVIFPVQNGQQVSLVQVYPASSPQDAATANLITHLRTQTVPQVVSGSNVAVYVGGNTAIFADFSKVLTSKLPLFIGLVVVLSFLLLALVFRSLIIPLTAAVMNLLSIGAAFGVLVAVFQWGWLSAIFGVNRAGPVESFLPVMLFAILFGLSMDYEVFLVSRIHEEWVKCGDAKEAVRKGLAATGKTITAAALIMILVFGSFMFGGQRVIKEFGLGLAAGILIDALIIRMTIVPALMFLFGKSNWWFPDWLDKHLPHLSAGGDEAVPEPAIEPSRPEPDPLPV
ncbi:MAG TPA: MMPL family transporter [Acidimicrobiales bacterium]|jgi:RND superfamily putative drug exporter|nr:MMPL family transporter [Acidimicrobiales bacterium]